MNISAIYYNILLRLDTFYVRPALSKDNSIFPLSYILNSLTQNLASQLLVINTKIHLHNNNIQKHSYYSLSYSG